MHAGAGHGLSFLYSEGRQGNRHRPARATDMTATSKSRAFAPQLELMKAWSEYLVDSDPAKPRRRSRAGRSRRRGGPDRRRRRAVVRVGSTVSPPLGQGAFANAVGSGL